MQGIYKIENMITNKVYIGQSVDIENRWVHHKINLRENIHDNDYLQSAWNKYGENAFNFSVIEECEKDKLTEREQYWIDYYGGIGSKNTYNLRDAESGHLTEEVCKKISNTLMGHIPWNKGLTAETDGRVAKYTERMKEFKIPYDMRKRISETVKQRHKEGVYDYKSMTEKRMQTQKNNGTIRKDKGVKRGKYSKEHCESISRGKIEANKKKRELGLPTRKTLKPRMLKTTVCAFCGKEFVQNTCRNQKFCCRRCAYDSRKKKVVEDNASISD